MDVLQRFHRLLPPSDLALGRRPLRQCANITSAELGRIRLASCPGLKRRNGYEQGEQWGGGASLPVLQLPARSQRPDGGATPQYQPLDRRDGRALATPAR